MIPNLILFLFSIFFIFLNKLFFEKNLFNFKINIKKGILLPLISIILLEFLIIFFSPNPILMKITVIQIISSLIFAPIGEEILFKGIFLGAFLLFIPWKKKKEKYIILFIVLLSFIFGFIHNINSINSLFNPYRILPFYLGSIFFIKNKKSLIPCFIIHFVHNLIAITYPIISFII